MKKVLFFLEIVVLLVFIGGLYIYGQVTSKMKKIEQPVLKEEEIVINPEAPKMTGYTTYALFGIDHRDKNASLGGENSDTIIIASVNNDTKDVKLVSVYRDTLLNIGSSDTYAKANAAYAYGGPEQAISMLNTNLDLDIKDYATVDFNALVTVIDLLGGLDIPMSYAEIEHMNNYCVETSKETGKSYTPIEKPEPAPENQEEIIGTYHLNGVQATSYCRIRYTSSLDMGRTERQRRVIQMIVSKAKTAGLSTIFDIMDEVFPMVKTSMNQTEILKMIPTLIGYSVDDTVGFPQSYKFSNIKGSIIVPTSLESNVIELHKFLYGEDNVYTPSTEVKAYSEKILEIVGGGEQLLDEAPATAEEDEGTDNDNFIWQDNGDNNDYDPDPGYTDPDPGYDPGYTDPDPGYDPGYTEPDPDPGYTDPDPGYTDPDPGYDPGYTEPDPDPGYEDPGYTEPEGGGEEGGYESGEAQESSGTSETEGLSEE